MATIMTIIIAFISTNIDDFFLLVILFSQVGSKIKKSDIVIGQYIGSAFLVLISAIASFGLSFLPNDIIGWLGVIPIILGIKTYVDYKKENKQVDGINWKQKEFIDHQLGKCRRFSIKQIAIVAILTMSNGADNISVYIPLFTHYDLKGWVLIAIIFSVMILLWCYAGFKMVSLPFIQDKLDKTRHMVIPIVFIALGLFILTKNGILF